MFGYPCMFCICVGIGFAVLTWESVYVLYLCRDRFCGIGKAFVCEKSFELCICL